MSSVKTDPTANGSTEQETVTEQPSYLTEDRANQIISSAITSHIKRLNLSKQVTDALETSLAPLREQLTGSKQASESVQGSERSTERAGSVSPELSAMQKKMDLMEKSIRDREQQIQAKERTGRERDAFARVTSELKELGVRPEGIDHLAKVLKVDGKIKVDDDGSVSFLDGEDERDLRDGLRAYLNPKTNPSVALFLPPKALSASKGKAEARGTSFQTSELEAIKAIKDPAKRAVAQIAYMNSSRKAQ